MSWFGVRYCHVPHFPIERGISMATVCPFGKLLGLHWDVTFAHISLTMRQPLGIDVSIFHTSRRQREFKFEFVRATFRSLRLVCVSIGDVLRL